MNGNKVQTMSKLHGQAGCPWHALVTKAKITATVRG